MSGAGLHDPLPGTDTSIGRALLAPTKLYVRQVLALLEGGGIKGLAHITGGGFTENIPRVLPKGIGAEITEGSWEELPIFGWLRKVSPATVKPRVCPCSPSLMPHFSANVAQKVP